MILRQRLTEWNRQAKDAGDPFPTVHIHDMDAAWQVWRWLEATDWRWPPSVLLEQPEALMDDIFAIAAINRGVKEQEDG